MAGQSKKGHRRQGQTQDEPLHAAARAGDLEAVRTILSSNPTAVNARDNHSRTPLHLAAWAGQTEVAQFLCEHKADVGAAAVDDMAAIHFASQKGHLQIIRTLLTSGVSVNACTRKGMTPLHYAVQGGHVELVKHLIRKGASLSAETKAGKRPIDLAKNDESCSVLMTCEESLRSNKDMRTNEASEASASNVTDKTDALGAKPGDISMGREGIEDVNLDEEVYADVGRGQRAREEEEMAAEIGPQPKKAKVALSHLVDDDTREEES